MYSVAVSTKMKVFEPKIRWFIKKPIGVNGFDLLLKNACNTSSIQRFISIQAKEAAVRFKEIQEWIQAAQTIQTKKIFP